MLEQCTHCNRRMGEKALKEHYKRKHDVSKRKGFKNHEIKHNGELLKVMTCKYGIYACRSCVFESHSLDDMYKHDLMVHQLTYEEAKSLKNAKKLFCDICWIEFEEIEHIDRHRESILHLEKEKYVEGTGCDICRIEFPASAMIPHEETERHQLYLNYEKGSGCDLCAKSREELLASCKQSYKHTLDTILRFHQSRMYKKHKQISNYEIGSGCDICYSPTEVRVSVHKPKTHQQILKRMEAIKCKTRAKSARSVYKN